jgi:site-specific DNA-methyltransferase (adenine-specific)
MLAKKVKPVKRPPGKKIKRPPGKRVPKFDMSIFQSQPEASQVVWGRPEGVVLEMDAIQLLKNLKDESVDLAVFDPAYESLEKHRKSGTTTRLKQSKASSNDWFGTFPNASYWPLFEQLYRVMKPGTFIFMFCDQETRDIVVHGAHPDVEDSIVDPGQWGPLVETGFKLWKSIIWDKEHAGMGYHFRARHEFIILAEKVVKKNKHRKLNDLGMPDVLQHTRLKGSSFYPTEKPAGLIKDLIIQGSNEGDLVVDFFSGSGVTGQVCRENNRRFVLGDLKTDQIIKRLGL